jgi:hypothetical protein
MSGVKLREVLVGQSTAQARRIRMVIFVLVIGGLGSALTSVQPRLETAGLSRHQAFWALHLPLTAVMIGYATWIAKADRARRRAEAATPIA